MAAAVAILQPRALHLKTFPIHIDDAREKAVRGENSVEMGKRGGGYLIFGADLEIDEKLRFVIPILYL